MEQQQERPRTGPKLGPPPSNKFNWSMHIKNLTSGFRPTRPRAFRLSEIDRSPQQESHTDSSSPQRQQPDLRAAATTTHTPTTSSGENGDQIKERIEARDTLEADAAVAAGVVGEAAGTKSSRPVQTQPSTTELSQDEHFVASSSTISGNELHPNVAGSTISASKNEQRPASVKAADSSPDPSNLATYSADAKGDSSSKGRQETALPVERTTVSVFEAERRREWVKEHVWQILSHKLRGSERISGGTIVETDSQILIIKCYGPARTKAREIRKLLEKADHKPALRGFFLDVREECEPGTDLTLLGIPGVSAAVEDKHTNSSGPTQSKSVMRDRSSNATYWDSDSIPVDCLFPRRFQLTTNTLCGALVRVTTDECREETKLLSWTCGGIIYVNNMPYGLTTAHPLHFDSRRTDRDGLENAEPTVTDTILPQYTKSSLETHVQTETLQNWTPLGRVFRHVMSGSSHVPANYDWLLIDIPKDHVLPNLTTDRDQRHAGILSENPGSTSICTWRGLLQATLLPGVSFMMIGRSSFKTMKLSVNHPMGKSNLGRFVDVCQ
jgi:hypothetical protein